MTVADSAFCLLDFFRRERRATAGNLMTVPMSQSPNPGPHGPAPIDNRFPD
jgi:hypothetical protein